MHRQDAYKELRLLPSSSLTNLVDELWLGTFFHYDILVFRGCLLAEGCGLKWGVMKYRDEDVVRFDIQMDQADRMNIPQAL